MRFCRGENIPETVNVSGKMWNVILDKMNYQKIMSCANWDWEQSELRKLKNVKKMQNINEDFKITFTNECTIYLTYKC
jgi:hypothetical protein